MRAEKDMACIELAVAIADVRVKGIQTVGSVEDNRL